MPVCSKRHRRGVDPSVFVLLLPLPNPKLADDVALFTLAPHHVLVRHKALQAHWAARVDPARADPDLRAEPIAEPVRKARAGVHERPRGVDAAAERRRGALVLGDDAVRVVRAVRVDVRDGGGERGHGEDGEREGEVLRVVVFGFAWAHLCRGEGGEGEERRERRGVAEELDASGEKCFGYLRPNGGQKAFVDNQRLCSVACRWIIGLFKSDKQTQFMPCTAIVRTFASTAILTDLSLSADSPRYTAHSPSAWPITGIRVLFWMFLTSALLPRGMTRLMYWSRESSADTSARVWMAWIYVLGIAVLANADWIAFDRRCAVSFDSFPPFKIAAFPASLVHPVH